MFTVLDCKKNVLFNSIIHCKTDATRILPAVLLFQDNLWYDFPVTRQVLCVVDSQTDSDVTIIFIIHTEHTWWEIK
jgi:hypothetical protein